MNKVLLRMCMVVLTGFLVASSTLWAVTEVTLVDESPSSQEAIGNNWLLTIGINEYRNWPELATSVTDAMGVANVLLENYYFKEKCLIELYDRNATKTAILEKLEFLSKHLLPEDSLVIFFSGHGYVNPTTKKGSWIPVDGDAISPKNWITNDEIIRMIQPDSIKAKHVLVIADSVFAADNLIDDPESPANRSRASIEMAFASPSRQFISSSYKVPVIPKGTRASSAFTRSLLQVLNATKEGFFPISSCYYDLKLKVHASSGQSPLFSRLFMGDAQGEFVFLLNTSVDRNSTSLFLSARKKELLALKNLALKNPGHKQWPSDKLLAYPEEKDRFKEEFERIAKESKGTVMSRQDLRIEPAPMPEPEPVAAAPIPEPVTEVKPETMVAPAPVAVPLIQEEVETKAAVMSDPFPATLGKPMLGNKLGMTFRYVGPGSFTMGSSSGDSDEKPYQVTLTRGFYLQTTEVTQAQWAALMGNNPSGFSDCGRDCPVENVSWQEVQEFITKLNAIENGPRYRLPTEAEWEYACRAGSTGDYPQNANVAELSWFNRNAEKRTHPVASKQPNPWGFSDMHGNVWEWCESSYKPYPNKPVTDPDASSGGYYKVQRGGSWDESAYVCRSANRMYNEPDFKQNDVGFRLVRIQ